MVDSSATVIKSGLIIGYVGIANSTTGSKIAVFFCANNTQMIISVSGTYSTSCGGAGATTPPQTYVTWSGNSNGTVILDGSSKRYQVRASDRRVVNSTGTVLNTLTVDSSANVFQSGVSIGSVGQASATDGSTIAVFYCNNSTYMTITETSTTYSTSCGGGSGGTTPNPTASFVYRELGYARNAYGGNNYSLSVTNTSAATNETCLANFNVHFFYNSQRVNESHQVSLALLSPGQTKTMTFEGYADQNLQGIPFHVNFILDSYDINCMAW